MIDKAGNVTSTAFTPYHPGRYSYYFAGDTGDYFTIESPTSALSFGTDTDFCIEMWLYPFDASASHTLVDMRPDSTNGAYIGNLSGLVSDDRLPDEHGRRVLVVPHLYENRH